MSWLFPNKKEREEKASGLSKDQKVKMLNDSKFLKDYGDWISYYTTMDERLRGMDDEDFLRMIDASRRLEDRWENVSELREFYKERKKVMSSLYEERVRSDIEKYVAEVDVNEIIRVGGDQCINRVHFPLMITPFNGDNVQGHVIKRMVADIRYTRPHYSSPKTDGGWRSMLTDGSYLPVVSDEEFEELVGVTRQELREFSSFFVTEMVHVSMPLCAESLSDDDDVGHVSYCTIDIHTINGEVLRVRCLVELKDQVLDRLNEVCGFYE